MHAQERHMQRIFSFFGRRGKRRGKVVYKLVVYLFLFLRGVLILQVILHPVVQQAEGGFSGSHALLRFSHGFEENYDELLTGLFNK
jgi:hypothetical protein